VHQEDEPGEGPKEEEAGERRGGAPARFRTAARRQGSPPPSRGRSNKAERISASASAEPEKLLVEPGKEEAAVDLRRVQATTMDLP
jgi:hypothetical protein